MWNINYTQVYFRGVLWAVWGEYFISGDAFEYQIDAVKEYAQRVKEKEIDNSYLTIEEKENLKRLFKQQIDIITNGFKDELRRVGRIHTNCD